MDLIMALLHEEHHGPLSKLNVGIHPRSLSMESLRSPNYEILVSSICVGRWWWWNDCRSGFRLVCR